MAHPRSVRPTAPPRLRGGRPSRYTAELARRICDRLAVGEALRAVCRDDGLPSESTVRTWVLDDRGGFSAQYARAREIGYHSMFDQILEIADTPQEGITVKVGPNGTETRTGDMIEHRRLQVDTRKWMLSKALPKVYGDKLEVEHSASDELLAALDEAGERARNR